MKQILHISDQSPFLMLLRKTWERPSFGERGSRCNTFPPLPSPHPPFLEIMTFGYQNWQIDKLTVLIGSHVSLLKMANSEWTGEILIWRKKKHAYIDILFDDAKNIVTESCDLESVLNIFKPKRRTEIYLWL